MPDAYPWTRSLTGSQRLYPRRHALRARDAVDGGQRPLRPHRAGPAYAGPAQRGAPARQASDTVLVALLRGRLDRAKREYADVVDRPAPAAVQEWCGELPRARPTVGRRPQELGVLRAESERARGLAPQVVHQGPAVADTDAVGIREATERDAAALLARKQALD